MLQTLSLLQIEEDALTVLSEVGAKTTLRYAVQLLTPASIAARLAKRTAIQREDVRDTGELFLDAKSSAAMLREHDKDYMH